MYASAILFTLAATASARVVPFSPVAGAGASTSFSCSASASTQATSNILTCVPAFANIGQLGQISADLSAALGARTQGLPVNVNGQVAAGAGTTLNPNGLPIGGVCPTGTTAYCCSENTSANAVAGADASLAKALVNLGVNNLNLGCIGAIAKV